MKNIAIIGMGKLGMVLTKKFNSAGFKIKSFDKNPLVSDSSKTIAEAVENAEVVFLCIPTVANTPIVEEVKKYCPKNSIIVSFSKGVGADGKTAAEILSSAISDSALWAVIGGPMLYDEIEKNGNVIAVIGSEKDETAKTLKKIFKDSKIPTISNFNPFAVSFLGVLKNVYSVGAGIIVGFNQKEKERQIFSDKAIAEMKIFCENNKINQEIVDSPAGIGDFLATSNSLTSRNRAVGTEIAKQGKTTIYSEALKAGASFVERFPFIREKMPIFFDITEIIEGKRPAKSILDIF